MLEKNTFNQGFFFAEKTLFAQVENINKINVFPVADNDTGTNLYHSIDSIYRIIPSNISIKKQLALFSDQLFEKASGNSGFILSMLFNEIASNWPEEHINTPSDVGQVLFLSAQNTKLKITDYVKGGMISYVKTLANFLILMGNKLWSLSLYDIYTPSKKYESAKSTLQNGLKRNETELRALDQNSKAARDLRRDQRSKQNAIDDLNTEFKVQKDNERVIR